MAPIGMFTFASFTFKPKSRKNDILNIQFLPHRKDSLSIYKLKMD
jgi:hypothetical protein